MPFLHNIDPQWLEAEYRRWLAAPQSFTPEWQCFFEGFDLGRVPSEGELHIDLQEALLQSGVQSLIYRYRDIGHLLACTDPLAPCPISHPLLDLAAFGLAEADLDRHFHTRRFMKETATLREILETMQETYCRSIGVEFMYIQEPGERQWLIDRMEPVRNRRLFKLEEQLRVLSRLQQGTLFEEFLERRFLGQKRFSLEGGESLLVALDTLVTQAAVVGVKEATIGMAHRGRLNVLANILGKPLAAMFAEFEDNQEHGIVGEGDVKYHKGYSADVAGVHFSLMFNPSHLEAVDPVVEGKSRARQERQGADGKQRLLPVLVHGDAAFAGQGVIAETFNLSQLEGYGTGGTLHIVINNQIGFTTLPADSRSTRYATDVARMLMVPIFHVHGEDPEAVAWVTGLALEYRQTFGRDVVVEIICYRRHGHNEGDEPAFTQPLMYEQIKNRKALHLLYGERLVEQGVAGEVISRMAEGYHEALERAVSGEKLTADQSFGGDWQGVSREFVITPVETAVPAAELQQLMGKMAMLPDGFTPHPKVAQLYRKRLDSINGGSDIDWGGGEALAFASLLAEGVPVRLSGQDSRRGTFNHRHAVLHDIKTDQTHTPLAFVGRGRFQIYDSILSENAVLGFEYGYSVATPDGLTIWEAQFGDFANGAQVVIDQFIASGESKWGRASGIVMLLPHGYEGNGAEHSSARIERYLQLCGENNLQVVYPSTPAQLFHLLRRQVKQPFRKPLIVFTPKSMLRHPLCVSPLSDFSGGAFREIVADNGDPAGITSLLLCSGKLYFELLTERDKAGRRDVALIRVEQFYPFREDLLREALSPYLPQSKVSWVQEEPANMGPWPFLRSRLAQLLGTEPLYVGRAEAAAPAAGSHRRHAEEQAKLIAEAFAQ